MNKTERQREHFNSVAERYYDARRQENHLLLKSLMWSDFLMNKGALRRDGLKMLEPMCGFADGKALLEETLAISVDYTGFDYSEEVVERLKRDNPTLNVFHGDVSTIDITDSYDIVVLLGGLHHVPHVAPQVVQKMSDAIRPGGFFLNLEPTSGNWLFTRIRDKIYKRNTLFDDETERAFDVKDLTDMFENSGLVLEDIAYPGLLSYVLYYNPDAFPALNIGGKRTVRAAFGFDKLLIRNRVGRTLSFATLSLWRKPDDKEYNRKADVDHEDRARPS